MHSFPPRSPIQNPDTQHCTTISPSNIQRVPLSISNPYLTSLSSSATDADAEILNGWARLTEISPTSRLIETTSSLIHFTLSHLNRYHQPYTSETQLHSSIAEHLGLAASPTANPRVINCLNQLIFRRHNTNGFQPSRHLYG
jgi:hypothetical protein